MKKHTSRKRKATRRPIHPWPDLPFVVDMARGRCFWNCKSTDDGFDDSATGSHYALAYLRHEAAEHAKGDHHPLLGLIVGNMPREHTQLEISFLCVVGFAAREGRHEAERVVAYWDSKRAKLKAA